MRRNSGNIGPASVTTTSLATGVYDSFDQYNNKLDGIWPASLGVGFVASSYTITRGTTQNLTIAVSGYANQTLYLTLEETSNASTFDATYDTGGVQASWSYAGGPLTITLAPQLVTATATRSAASFKIAVRTGSAAGTIIGTSSAFTVPATSFSVAASTSSSEGGNSTFTISTSGYPNQTLNWSAQVNGNNPGWRFSSTYGSASLSTGSASFSVQSLRNYYTTGASQITVSVTIANTSGTTLNTTNYTINDTCGTVQWTASTTNVSEGSTVTFTGTSTGMTSGDGPFNWSTNTPSMSGADFSDGVTSGSAYVNGSNQLVISRTIANDAIIESSESFALNVSSPYADSTTVTPLVSITDTSTAITGVTYTPASSRPEGSSWTITPVGGNLTGKTINWTINPVIGTVTAADISQGLSGTITGTGPLTITPNADTTWEGSETFTITFAYSGTNLYTTPEFKIWDTSIESGSTAVVKNLDINTATMLTPTTDNSYCGGGYGDYSYYHKLIFRGSTSTTSARVTCYDQSTGIQDVALDTATSTYTAPTQNFVGALPFSGDYLMNFSPDGSKFLIWSPSNSYYLRIYTCSTPWVYNSGDSYNQKQLYVNYTYSRGGKIAISHDGLKVIISYYDGSTVRFESVTLPTAFDASSYTSSTYWTYVSSRAVGYYSNSYSSAIAQFEFNRFGTEVTLPVTSYNTDTASLVTYALTTAYDLTNIGTATARVTKAFDVPSTTYTPDRIKSFAFDRNYENRLYILYSQDSWNMRVAVATLSLELYGDPPAQEAFDITTLTAGSMGPWTGADSGSQQYFALTYTNGSPETNGYQFATGVYLPVVVTNRYEPARYIYGPGGTAPVQFMKWNAQYNNFDIYNTNWNATPTPNAWTYSSASGTCTLQSPLSGNFSQIIDFDITLNSNTMTYFIIVSYYDSNYGTVKWARYTMQASYAGQGQYQFPTNSNQQAQFSTEYGSLNYSYSYWYAKFQFNKDGTKITMFDPASNMNNTSSPLNFTLKTYTLASAYDLTGISSLTASASKTLAGPPMGSSNTYFHPSSFAFDRVLKNKMFTAHPVNPTGWPYWNGGYNMLKDWNIAPEVISWTSNTPFATTGLKPLGNKGFSSTATSFSITFDTNAHATQALAFFQAIGDIAVPALYIGMSWNGKYRNITWTGPSGVGGGSLSSSWSVNGKIVTFSNASASSIYTIGAEQENTFFTYNTIQISIGFAYMSAVDATSNTLKTTFTDASIATQLNTAFTNSACGIMTTSAYYGSPGTNYYVGPLGTNTVGAVGKTGSTFKIGFQSTISGNPGGFGGAFSIYLAEALGPTVQLAADGVIRPFSPQNVQYQGGYGYVSYDDAAKTTIMYNAANAWGYSSNVYVGGDGSGGYFQAQVWPSNNYTVSQQNSTMLYFSYMQQGGSPGPSGLVDSYVQLSPSWSFDGSSNMGPGSYNVSISGYSGPSLTWLSSNLANVYQIYIGNGNGTRYKLSGVSSLTYNGSAWNFTASSLTTDGAGYGSKNITIYFGVLTPGQNVTAGPYNLSYTNIPYGNNYPQLYFNSQSDATAFVNALKADQSGSFTVVDGNNSYINCSYPIQYINSVSVMNDYNGYGSYTISWPGMYYYYYNSPGNNGVYGGSTAAITYFVPAGGGAITLQQVNYNPANSWMEMDFASATVRDSCVSSINSGGGSKVWKIDAYNAYQSSSDIIYIQWNGSTAPDGVNGPPGPQYYYAYWSNYKYNVLSYQQYAGTKGPGQGTFTAA